MIFGSVGKEPGEDGFTWTQFVMTLTSDQAFVLWDTDREADVAMDETGTVKSWRYDEYPETLEGPWEE